MALYLVDYDLVKRKDYQTLFDALTALGAKRVLLSSWAFTHSNTTVVAVRDHLRQYIDSDDRLCVYQLANWASWNALTDLNKV